MAFDRGVGETVFVNGQECAYSPAPKTQVLASPVVIALHENTHGVAFVAYTDLARRCTYPAFEAVADHSRATTHGTFRNRSRCCVSHRFESMFTRHVKAVDVV